MSDKNHTLHILLRECHQLIELEQEMLLLADGGGDVAVTQVGSHMGLGNPQPPFFQ